MGYDGDDDGDGDGDGGRIMVKKAILQQSDSLRTKCPQSISRTHRLLLSF